jgi:hypothetical protein
VASTTPAPLRIQLESTDELVENPLPARVWRGNSDDGSEFVAFITIGTFQTGKPDVDARNQQALETRIVSTAVIEIPLEPVRLVIEP